MNVQVVSDARGRIISISTPGDTGPAPSGITRSGVVLEEGHHLHALEVPADFQGHTLVELTELLRVASPGSKPMLVAKSRPTARTSKSEIAKAKRAGRGTQQRRR